MNDHVQPDSGTSTLERIEKYISQAPENSRIFTITSDVAQELLETRNTFNRPRSPEGVRKLAEHMADSTFSLTGDTVKFAKSGHLLDGQHRLAACVQSGNSFRTHIVFGIEDDAFFNIDQGKKRTASHVLAIAGFKNSARLAAVIRWVNLIELERVKFRESPEPHEILKLAQTKYCPAVEPFLAMGQAINRVNPLIPDSLAAALLYSFDKANHKRAEEFYKAWSAGSFGGKNKIFEKLAKELRKLHEWSSGRVNDVVRAALMVKTWNLFLVKKLGTDKDFTWSLTDDFPYIED